MVGEKISVNDNINTVEGYICRTSTVNICWNYIVTYINQFKVRKENE